VNAQELFLDVSSGRFLDGESAIPTIKPSFFSDEQKRVNISVLKVKNNKVSSVTPSPDSKFRFRLGTTTLKLADATSVTSTPPTLFTAVGTVSTLSSLQAKGQSTIVTYSPTTATLEAIVVTFPVVTGTFQAKIDYTAPVTATITAGISSVTLPTTFRSVKTIPVPSDFLPKYRDNVVLTFTTLLNSPVTATFSATISGGTVTTISIINDGFGYLNGQYGLSFSGGSPSSVASAFAVASGGEILSVTIESGGSGYSSAPAVTMFLPAKQVTQIIPSNLISSGGVTGTIFKWGQSVSTSSRVELNFSALDNVSTPTTNSVPSAFLTYIEPFDSDFGKWKLNFVSGGYGYSQVPTTTHDPAFMISRGFSYNVAGASAGLAADYSRGEVFFASSESSSYSTTTRSVVVINGGMLPAQRGFGDDRPLWSLGSLYPTFATEGGYRLASVESIQALGFAKEVLQSPAPSALVGASKFIGIPARNKRKRASVRDTAINYDSFPFVPITNSNKENQSYYVVADPQTYSPTKYAIGIVEYAPLDTTVQVNQYYADRKVISSYGGGVFNPTITWLDFGEGYTDKSAISLVPISSLENNRIFSQQFNSPVSVVTGKSYGFYPSAFSKFPTIVTAFEGNQVSYNVSDGGLGFNNSGLIRFDGQSVTGGVTVVSLTNIPQNYIDGEYDCTVATSPSGNTAKVSIYVSGGSVVPFIKDTGFGYSTAPIVTAPSPNKESGQITDIVVITRPQGYSLDTLQYLSIANSSVCGGNAVAYFTTNSDNITSVFIDNPGYGYQSVPLVTAPSPDLASKNGFISSINLTNQPKGYIVGQEYDLQIQNSPTVSGSAVAKLIRSDETRFDVSIINSGYGYTSAPVITAPAPDAPQGILNIVSVTTLGRGYAPGTYNCTVDKAPGGETTAIVNFISESPKVGRFEVVDAGRGYVVAPAVVVPTPAGNVLNQITISCQGNYYINNTANFVISDGSGQGQETGSSILDSGKILGVNVLNGGYGFTNNPTIVFTPPTAPVVATIPEYVIQGDLNITTASANAILSTATQRDILMEVYETDGTNEQVVAQATVSLAKRVLE
jgi:hypothetical protein